MSEPLIFMKKFSSLSAFEIMLLAAMAVTLANMIWPAGPKEVRAENRATNAPVKTFKVRLDAFLESKTNAPEKR